MFDLPPHPQVVHQGVVHFGIFRLCESPTSLTVVGADFARDYRQSKGILFV